MMKVIDLLNKIANGEIPEKIRYDDLFMTYDKQRQNYYDSIGAEIDWKYTVMQYLNDKVEIIEEDKKIDKLNAKYHSQVDKVKLANKIDEIIDYINKENK